MSTELKPNKEFKIVFTCNKRHFWGKYQRTFIGAGSLQKWIGAENANKAIREALECGQDKFTKRFRKFGRVEFYAK